MFGCSRSSNRLMGRLRLECRTLASETLALARVDGLSFARCLRPILALTHG